MSSWRTTVRHRPGRLSRVRCDPQCRLRYAAWLGQALWLGASRRWTVVVLLRASSSNADATVEEIADQMKCRRRRWHLRPCHSVTHRLRWRDDDAQRSLFLRTSHPVGTLEGALRLTSTSCSACRDNSRTTQFCGQRAPRRPSRRSLRDWAGPGTNRQGLRCLVSTLGRQVRASTRFSWPDRPAEARRPTPPRSILAVLCTVVLCLGSPPQSATTRTTSLPFTRR